MIGRRKKELPAKKLEEAQKDPLIDADEDGSEQIISKNHPSKTYSKIHLYDRWVEARTEKN